MAVGLPGLCVRNREHVRSVTRAPNGNDYGKDLLRQHYERRGHDPDRLHEQAIAPHLLAHVNNHPSACLASENFLC